MPTAITLITDSLVEIGAVGEGQTVSGADADRGLRILNRLIGQWNVQRLYLPALLVKSFNLVGSTQTYTIGDSATIDTPRPNEVRSANLIVSDIGTPLNIRGPEWWAAQSNKLLTAAYPTDLFYNRTGATGFGTIYIWPIPTAVYAIQLMLAVKLSVFADLTTTYYFEDGVEEALVKTLGEKFCIPWGKEITEDLRRQAREARAVIKETNSKAKRIISDFPDSGGTYVNYLTREIF